MSERIKDSVTPSGVKFSVRQLFGADQDMLTKESGGDSNAMKFNKMLHGSMRSLGVKGQTELTIKDIQNLLSNDRKFILLTLRQHTLKYKKTFDFKYEFPLRRGHNQKEQFEYSVEFSHENFPITPYYWVREEIEKEKKDNPDYRPDGHEVLFPEVFQDYSDMLNTYREVKGTFPESKLAYVWQLLDGNAELKWGPSLEDIRINMMLEMRSPKIKALQQMNSEQKKEDVWTSFETGRADLLDIEYMRSEIREKEGVVDTFLTIQHPNDLSRSQRVDLITLPVFFFPSQAV